MLGKLQLIDDLILIAVRLDHKKKVFLGENKSYQSHLWPPFSLVTTR